MAQRSEESKGLLLGFIAYGTWGFFPLYWPLLDPSSAYEVLAYRVVWSLAFMLIVNSVWSLWPPVRAALRDTRVRRLLVLASGLVTLNWGVYIWAVQNGHVVDAALGYFVTPLLNVALGILAFGERLRRVQWVALSIGAASLVLLAVDAGTVPWIGLVLAVSFACYGLVKKLAGVEAMTSLTVETLIAFPFAFAYLGALEWTGQLAFGHTSWGHTLMAMSAGPVTALPLLGFGAAAVRIPLSTMGLLQYTTPVLQFVLGVLVFHEHMSGLKWIAFGTLWIALIMNSVDMLRHARAARRDDVLAFE